MLGLGVYPRECGGTWTPSCHTRTRMGLSPRVRGNRDLALGHPLAVGSIPASAGEPRGRRTKRSSGRVYPRECGGTRELDHKRSARIGSIPASAGEPLAGVDRRWRCWVYPRECGGTMRSVSPNGFETGLSPRVRGNQRPSIVAVPGSGSIPASAGEPVPIMRAKSQSRVYPRECGGTAISGSPVQSTYGLSPRVRGNQRRREEDGVGFGSIPASAGEPTDRSPPPRRIRVYPRECGGTCADQDDGRLDQGLSPRVRGNRRRGRASPVDQGSIPASAGEPQGDGLWRRRSRVYPRECGGTVSRIGRKRRAPGLSPRVRGNLALRRRARRRAGSIPASAGEPKPGDRRGQRQGVYPRECGGTALVGVWGGNWSGLSPRVRGNPGAFGRRRAFRRVYPRECGGTAARTTLLWPRRGLSPRVRGNL